jgi:UDP-N-acetyl-D-glucosamine dehydrogenase
MNAGTEKVVLIGQGYVGLPLAMRAVEAGHDVVGIDLDVSRVKKLEAGESFVEDVPSERLGPGATGPATTTSTRPGSTSA